MIKQMSGQLRHCVERQITDRMMYQSSAIKTTYKLQIMSTDDVPVLQLFLLTYSTMDDARDEELLAAMDEFEDDGK